MTAIRTGLLALALLAASMACDGEDGGNGRWFGGGDGRSVASSATDARLGEDGLLEFQVTSDIYRRWTVAQQALGRTPLGRSITRLGRRALTQRELEEAVQKVQDDEAARTAVANAGMSPLEYVYATVAIEQAMAVAKGNLSPRRGGSPAPQQNAEVARRYEEDVLTGAVLVDTTPPDVPVVDPQPQPQPLPAPTPRDTMAPPQPRPQPQPQPQPQPAPRDTARPAPIPAPARSRPVPTPQPVPDPDPPPADTARGSGARR